MYATIPGPTLASDAQVEYLRDLLAERQPEHLVLLGSMLAEGTLTKKLASEKIDYLKKLPVQGTATTPQEDPLKLLPVGGRGVGRYALKEDDRWVFYEVVERKTGRRFLNRLIGAPSDWQRQFLPPMIQRSVAREILEMGSKASALAYAEQHGRCSMCNSPLSDPKSILRSMGPTCAGRFGG